MSISATYTCDRCGVVMKVAGVRITGLEMSSLDVCQACAADLRVFMLGEATPGLPRGGTGGDG